MYLARSPLPLSSMVLIIQSLFQDELFDSYVEWTKALFYVAKSRGLANNSLKIEKQITVAKKNHDRAYHSISWQKESNDFR